MHFTENFRQALQDYIFMLNKKYPEKTIHEMVSTRYALSQFERSMLYRGITTSERAEKRRSRIVPAKKLNGHPLHIDLYNVLYTLAAYLRGFPVFYSNDNLLRDASESHGTGEWEVHLGKGLDLLIRSLASLKITKAVFYIDQPLDRSHGFSEKITGDAFQLKCKTEVIADASPDHLIREAREGMIATSDSTIIDKSSLPVFDLARHVIEFHFEPVILRLDDLAKG